MPKMTKQGVRDLGNARRKPRELPPEQAVRAAESTCPPFKRCTKPNCDICGWNEVLYYLDPTNR